MKRIIILLTLFVLTISVKAQFWIPNDFAVDFTESIRVHDSIYAGANDEFLVDETGDIKNIKALTYDWPDSLRTVGTRWFLAGSGTGAYDLDWRRIRKTDIAELDSTEVLFGDAAGNVAQDDDLYFNAYLNRLHSPQIEIPTTTSGGDGVIYMNGSSFLYNKGSNLFLGLNVGNLTSFGGGNNVGVGSGSLQNVTNGSTNVTVGNYALEQTITGTGNVAVGYTAGRKSMGEYNTYLGGGSAGGSTSKPSAAYNTAVGAFSLNEALGRYNIALGVYAAQSITTGSNNIIIGNRAYGSAALNNRLMIGSDTALAVTEPLIYGDFAADSLKINGSLKVRDLALYNGDTMVVWNPLTKKLDYRLVSGLSGSNLGNADLTQTDAVRYYDADGGTLNISSTNTTIGQINLSPSEVNVNWQPAGMGSTEMILDANGAILRDYDGSDESYFLAKGGTATITTDELILTNTPPVETGDTVLLYNKFSNEVTVGSLSAITGGSFLKLDQTTPQTVINGTPTFSQAMNISDVVTAGSGALAGSLLNLTQTWNTSGSPTAIKLNVTKTASNAASLLMDLQVGGVSRFKVSHDGNVTAIGYFQSTGTGFRSASGSAASPGYTFGSDLTMGMWRSSSDLAFSTGGAEKLRIANDGLIKIQGTTSSFPAIKRNGAGIDIRLADDSDYGTLIAGSIGVGVSPTANVHIKAGTATASTAPLKLEVGTALTAAEGGVMNHVGTTTNSIFTITPYVNSTAQVNTVSGVITKTDTGDPANSYEGQLCINTFDNTYKVYAEGAWRTITTW